MDEVRYCGRGCGYRLPEEYGPTETWCGACLDYEDYVEAIYAQQGGE